MDMNQAEPDNILTHYTPKLPSYRNQLIDLQSRLIELTTMYMVKTATEDSGQTYTIFANDQQLFKITNR